VYAVFQSGGKQYRVSPGDTVDLELLEAEPGSEVSLDDVRFVGGSGEALVGTPTVDGASVIGEVVGDVKGPKIRVLTMKRRKGSRHHAGHRQRHTRVRIVDIKTP